MPSAVPYTALLEGQFRQARRFLDAGEPLPSTLVVVGQQDSVITLLPLLSTQEIAEQWFYERGRLAVSLHPRAACIVQDVASAALGLFGQPRAVVISYQDRDGLKRAQALGYGAPFEGAIIAWSEFPQPLPDGDTRWRAAELVCFWRGATAAQAAIERSKPVRRGPTWRFRR